MEKKIASSENRVYYSENLKSASLGDEIVLFDRTIEVYGLKFLVGGQVGMQSAVPDEWAYKSAQTVKLMLNPEADGINKTAQENLIKTLKGDTGTWHEGAPTVQRVLKGGSADYSPNPLEDGGYALYGRDVETLFDTHMSNDMIWYQNSSHDVVTTAGDTDIQELLEHLMHTIHVYGVRGGVNGSVQALNADIDTAGWNTTELYFALKEAVNNGAFDISGYNDADYTNPETYAVASKEYTYLLNFGMWEYGSEFWPDKDANGLGMLEGEWADNVRTPEGVKENNPLGFALFNEYFAPVLSKPDVETLRSMFQDNDQGLSGYIWDPDTTHKVIAVVATRDGSKIFNADVIMSDGINSSLYKSDSDGNVTVALNAGSISNVTASLAYSTSSKAISSQDALDALKLSVGLATSAGTKRAFDFMSADFNKDGKVTSQDALSILKYSVGLETTGQAKWVFVDANGDYSGVSKSNTSFAEGVSIADLSVDTTIGLTGILMGDVNDSYSGLIA